MVDVEEEEEEEQRRRLTETNRHKHTQNTYKLTGEEEGERECIECVKVEESEE